MPVPETLRVRRAKRVPDPRFARPMNQAAGALSSNWISFHWAAALVRAGALKHSNSGWGSGHGADGRRARSAELEDGVTHQRVSGGQLRSVAV
ncbi:MAG: hypothetical protein AAGG45_11295, partial [Pseudomonadota bacterium]